MAARCTALGLALAFSACSGPIADSDGLRSALEGAEPGDVVEVSAGRFESSFTVPPGVTVRGAGAGLTQIVAPTDLSALIVRPNTSAPPTRIEGLTVVSEKNDGGERVYRIAVAT